MDTGRQNCAFISYLALLKGQGGTGRDTGLWYRCGTKASLTYSIGGGTRTHTPRREPDFESDKNRGMVRDAALRSVFVNLFASLCGILRVRVRPDCHQSGHQNHRPEG
jgi:hypothetical protein